MRAMKYVIILFLFLGWYKAGISQNSETPESEQSNDFESGAAAFSAKPIDMWEIGIHTGLNYMSSDVRSSYPGGFGVGVHLRKAVSYTFSLRGEFTYGQMRGLENRAYNAATTNANSVLRSLGYGNEGGGFVRNYQTSYYALNGQLIINAGNILFHNPTPKWNIYGLVGLGVYGFNTKYDALDANGQIYDFSNIDYQADDAKDQIEALLDGEFETDALRPDGFLSIFGNDLNLSAQLGFGVSRKLSNRVNLSLEHSYSLNFYDYVDGYVQRTAQDRSNYPDNTHYTSVRININIGSFDKKVEPLYWVNPLNSAYNDIAALKQRPELDLTDSDNDGVLDMFDADTETPQGAAVDVKGKAIDTDNDGIPDYRDEELFSPQGYPIDENGVAQVDDPYLTRSEIELMIEGKLDEVRMNWWLPMINFDLNSSDIRPQMIPKLQQIASVIKNNPNVNVVVKGYADNRADESYNEVLSYKRSLAAINYLNERYGIDKSRFIIQYGGEGDPIIQNLPEKKNVSRDIEDQHYLNRRVEFSIAGPKDQPMDPPANQKQGVEPKYKGNTNTGY